MAQSLKKQVERSKEARDALVARIFALAEHGNMRFSECKAKAPLDLRAAYDASETKVIQLEAEAVMTGRAYRGAFGMLRWS